MRCVELRILINLLLFLLPPLHTIPTQKGRPTIFDIERGVWGFAFYFDFDFFWRGYLCAVSCFDTWKAGRQAWVGISLDFRVYFFGWFSLAVFFLPWREGSL